MKKKLSILIYSLAGGGAEKVVSILLESLKEHFDVTLVLMNSSIVYNIPSSQKIFYLENSNPVENALYKFAKLPILALKYKRFCQKNNIHITLSFTNRPNYIALFSKLFGNNAKLIICERSTPSKVYARNSFSSLANKWLIRFLYPHADKIVTNSRGGKDDLVNNFFIPIHLIDTISNPIDMDQILQKKQEPLVFEKEKFTFITIGRLNEDKNHEMLIKSFVNLSDSNTQLLILGEGPLYGDLKNLIIKLELTNRVFLLNFIDNPYKYLAQANCFLFGSRYEGFPNVLLEALACGLPIISTDCQSGPREILAPLTSSETILKNDIELAEYGILFPVDNQAQLMLAIEQVLYAPSLIKTYQQKATIRAQDFSKEKITRQFIEVIESLLDTKGTACAE